MQLKINRNITPNTAEPHAQLNIVSPRNTSQSSQQEPTYQRRTRPLQTTITDHIIIENESEAGKDIYPSGDPWVPREPDDGIVRAASNNINGSEMSRGLEIATDIDVTDELGIDIMGLQETKKPWNAANIRLYNQQTQLKWPQGARNIFSSAPWKYDEKDYMAGGTLLSVNGRTKGRIVETGSDKWGRFCFTTLRGARDEGVVVINGYRTCHTKTDNPGSLTQYHAEYVGLRETGIKNPEPRFQFFKDLTTLIDEKRQQGFRPIVMMDANED